MRFLLSLLALAFTSWALQGPNVNSVVTHLPRFQGESGGFHTGAAENLQDTSYALFISSLFGEHARIDTSRVAQFLEKLNNPDHGFGNQVGASSDLESVRNALHSYLSLGQTINDAPSIAAFVHDCFDSNLNLFSNTKGGTGDLKSTAAAFEAFQFLNLNDNKVQEKQNAVKKGLSNLFKSEGGRKYFSSLTSDNYYGIVAGKFVNFDFGDVAPWAKYFQERQAANGGFFSDADRSEVTVEDTAHSVLALYALDKSLPDTINVVQSGGLIDFINNLPGTPKTAALSYQAVARTSAFQDVFKIDASFTNSKHIAWASPNIFVQGSIVAPVLSVKTAFGLPHPALVISTTVSHETKSDNLNLSFDPEKEAYFSPVTFDTTGLFGTLTYRFTLNWDVVGFELSRDFEVSKPISYWTDIRAKADWAGKLVEKQGVIGPGAIFSFDILFGTVTETPKKSMRSGDFKATLTVLDSSAIQIFSRTIEGKGNKDIVHFDYQLEDTSLPAGYITFLFQFSKDGVAIHTKDAVAYNYVVPMVASEITFVNKKDKFQIGDTVQISMAPGSLPDLRTVEHYKIEHRNFFLTVSGGDSAQAHFTIDGACSLKSHVQCSFSIPIEANFHSLGSKQINFFYKPVGGNIIPLQNYDSASSELFEEGHHVQYFVDSKLQVTSDSNKPKSGTLVYGNKIQFSFKVEDDVSKKSVWDTQGSNSLFLALRHEKGKTTAFTSDLQPIRTVVKDGKPQHFQVDWTVNPNAVKGASSLELIVVGADGKELPLLSGSSAWSVPIEIGGKIDVDQKSHTLILESDETAFFVDFALSCEKAPLHDASLVAQVHLVDSKTPSPITSQPVILGPGGKYQISWNLASKDAPSGQYNVKVYRDVDRRRFGDAAEPFFTTAVHHSVPMASPLPMKTEYFVLCLMIAAFIFTSLKKIEIEKPVSLKKSR